MVLRATFGILISRDHGKSWNWICESAVGYGTTEDPALTVMSGGALLASSAEGLAVSRDDGCGWSFAGGPLDKQVLIDGTVRGDGALVISATPIGVDGGSELRNVQVFASSDGATWAPSGPALDPTVFPTSVEVGGSKVYVTATRGVQPSLTASLFVSTDGGAWAEHAISVDSAAGEAAYIAAVSGDRVFVRTSGASKSRLLVTDDGGQNFQVVYSGGPMLGFALSTDGATAYFGGPEDGFLSGSTADLHFTQRSPLPIGCLAVSGPRIYACVVQSAVLLAASDDNGTTFTPVLHLAELAGPLACPANTCDGEWPDLQTRFGIGLDAGTDAGADAGAPPATPTPQAKGSGCADGGSDPSGAPLAWVFGILAGAWRLTGRSRRRWRRPD
jgi:hypothetical protein